MSISKSIGAAALAALAVCGLSSQEASAHHSFSYFDATKKISITGTVAKFEWSNPHVWIQVLVPNPAGGPPTEWSIEAPAINGLQRAGWTSRSLKPGDKVTVSLHPLNSGGPGGALADVVLANGQRLGQTMVQRARDQSGQ